MVTNPVIEAIKSRRSIRSYESKPVSDPAIQAILEAATNAPSAGNAQPWKFTIVTNKEKMKQLSDTSKAALLLALSGVADEGVSRFRRPLQDPNFNIFYDAPLLVLISGAKTGARTQFVVNDCSLAAQNMMLAAYTLGVGSCWIGMAAQGVNDSKVKAELGVPEDHAVYAALIFGYPKGGFPKAPEKHPAQILKRID